MPHEQALHDHEGFYSFFDIKPFAIMEKAMETRPARRPSAGTGNSGDRERAG
jgi:hypothetical protein